MEPRIDYARNAPDALRALMTLENYIRESGLEEPLIHLVKLRASQMNGCASFVCMSTQ